jgi:hypothetical protein
VLISNSMTKFFNLVLIGNSFAYHVERVVRYTTKSAISKHTRDKKCYFVVNYIVTRIEDFKRVHVLSCFVAGS